MKILVTGGAGFIASHIVDAYVALGHEVVILDNLSTGRRQNINPGARFVEGDIRDGETVKRLFSEESFEVVNHHAAQMDVRRSVADPSYDASVNIMGALSLFEECLRHGVGKIIFASSGGAIYGEQEYFPADERHPTGRGGRSCGHFRQQAAGGTPAGDQRRRQADKGLRLRG